MEETAVTKPEKEMDGVYFRVKRGNRFCNICFSDLTTPERYMVMEGRDIDWLKALCDILGDALYNAGEAVGTDVEEEE